MRYLLMLAAGMVATAVHADSVSNGPLGINSGYKLPDGTFLRGQGVGIGQVEPERAGKPNHDIHPEDYNSAVKPFAVYDDSQPASPGEGVRFGPNPGHATRVASIVIADGTLNDTPGHSYVGVASEASLYSSAFEPTSPSNPYLDVMSASEVITNPNLVPRVRTVNHSYGTAVSGGAFPVPDGNSPLSQYVDWSAYRNDVLHVVGTNADYQPGNPTPSDNFNGITVGASTQSNVFGHWDRVADFNVFDEDHDAFGDRVSIDILAPGEHLKSLGLDNDIIHDHFGTSIAAPQVTGAIAHLRQLGDYFITNIGGPHWDVDRANRHEVIKAVLLNSADKLAGIHGSSRDIELQGGAGTWINTTAAGDIAKPLDEQMGAGHLMISAREMNLILS